MKYQNTTVKLQDITIGKNVRLPNNLNLDTLRDSIAINGLQEPITVWNPTKETTELIRGHRRVAAISQIATKDQQRFAELFGKGIPCFLATGITSIEAVLLKLDHDGQQGLSHPYELQETANQLFAIGKDEAEVVALTSGLMDKVCPMSPKVRAEIVELRKAGKEADAEKRVFDYRRGLVQSLHNAFRAPDKVMFALYRQATGVAPEGVTEYLPNLTTAQVTKLWSEHMKDAGILEKGMPKYSKAIPGPLFSTLWESLCKEDKEKASKPKENRPKAMSSKDMRDEVTGRGFKSEVVCKLIDYHAGNKESGADIGDLDTFAYYGDLLRKHDATSWEKVVATAKEIESRLVAAVVAK